MESRNPSNTSLLYSLREAALAFLNKCDDRWLIKALNTSLTTERKDGKVVNTTVGQNDPNLISEFADIIETINNLPKTGLNSIILACIHNAFFSVMEKISSSGDSANKLQEFAALKAFQIFLPKAYEQQVILDELQAKKRKEEQLEQQRENEMKLHNSAPYIIENFLIPLNELWQSIKNSKDVNRIRLRIIEELRDNLKNLHNRLHTYALPAMAVNEALKFIRIAFTDITSTERGKNTEEFLLLTSFLSEEKLNEIKETFPQDGRLNILKNNIFTPEKTLKNYSLFERNAQLTQIPAFKEKENTVALIELMKEICVNLLTRYAGQDMVERINKLYDYLYNNDRDERKLKNVTNFAAYHFIQSKYYPEDEMKFYLYVKNKDMLALTKLKKETIVEVEVVKLPKPAISPHRDEDLDIQPAWKGTLKK